MGRLDNIHEVIITRQTKPTSQKGFTIVAIVGPNRTFVGRAKVYNSNDLTGLAADLTNGVADPEYIAASAIASQNPKIPQFMIGYEDTVGDADMTATLNAIALENNDWYGLIITDRTGQKVKDAGAWALANEKIMANASLEANILSEADGVDTTSLAYWFKNLSNDRISLFYKGDSATKYTDAAYLGQMLAYIPGTWTGMAKSLPGEAVDDLSASDEKNALDKFCNIYEEIGEVNVVRDGFVSSGEFTDIIVFVDWLKARIQEDVWAIQVNVQKISYDDPGIVSIQSAISKRLKIAQDNGAITADSYDIITKERTGGFVVEVPTAASVPQVDKTARILRNVKFTCWYSSAIHTTKIAGTLVL